MSNDAPIIVIGGQVTAIARAILGRFPREVCVDVDEIREPVSGLASRLAWNDESTLQIGLALDASASASACHRAAR